MHNDTGRRVVAEFFGTFWLTFGGCGAAVLAAKFPDALGIGFLGVAFAFGGPDLVGNTFFCQTFL